MLGAVEWLLKRIAELAFGQGLFFAPVFAYEGDWRGMSISLGVATASFVYWLATYTTEDLTRSG